MTSVDHTPPVARGNAARGAMRSYFAEGLGSWVGPGALFAGLAALSFELPTSFSDSGHLTVYYSEPFALILGVSLVVALVARRYRPSVWGRRMLAVLIAFMAWYLVICIARSVFGGNVKQSLLVVRTTILPVVAFFLVDAGWENRRRTLGGLVLLNTILVALHLPDWNNMRGSDYLGNSIVFGTVLVLLVPVNMLLFVRKEATHQVIRWASGFNLVAALVLPIWTGSRSPAVMAIFAFVASLLVIRPAKRDVVKALGVVLVAVIIHSSVWLFNPQGSAYALYRLFPTPGQVGEALGWDALGRFDSADREEHSDVGADELQRADDSRAELMQLAWREFQSSPIFGTGQVYFEIDSYKGPALYSAHNFVLDHLNAYGLIGFLIYIGSFVMLLARKIGHWRFSDPLARDNGISLVMTAVLMGVSLTQPTMMIQLVITLYFVAIPALQLMDEGGDMLSEGRASEGLPSLTS